MEVIRFLAKHILTREGIVITLMFVAAIWELIDIFSKKCTYEKKEKIFSYIIAFSYIIEAILFSIRSLNVVINAICTLFCVTLLVCLILRLRLRIAKAKKAKQASL